MKVFYKLSSLFKKNKNTNIKKLSIYTYKIRTQGYIVLSFFLLRYSTVPSITSYDLFIILRNIRAVKKGSTRILYHWYITGTISRKKKTLCVLTSSPYSKCSAILCLYLKLRQNFQVQITVLTLLILNGLQQFYFFLVMHECVLSYVWLFVTPGSMVCIGNNISSPSRKLFPKCFELWESCNLHIPSGCSVPSLFLSYMLMKSTMHLRGFHNILTNIFRCFVGGFSSYWVFDILLKQHLVISTKLLKLSLLRWENWSLTTESCCEDKMNFSICKVYHCLVHSKYSINGGYFPPT